MRSSVGLESDGGRENSREDRNKLAVGDNLLIAIVYRSSWLATGYKYAYEVFLSRDELYAVLDCIFDTNDPPYLSANQSSALQYRYQYFGSIYGDSSVKLYYYSRLSSWIHKPIPRAPLLISVQTSSCTAVSPAMASRPRTPDGRANGHRGEPPSYSDVSNDETLVNLHSNGSTTRLLSSDEASGRNLYVPPSKTLHVSIAHDRETQQQKPHGSSEPSCTIRLDPEDTTLMSSQNL